MKKSLLLLLIASATFFACGELQTATANDWCGNGFGDGYYWGFYNRRSIDTSQLPPYYAQFPPVYYSTQIARPYGWSPFAIRGNEYDRLPVVNIAPKTVMNPYFKQEISPASSDTNKTTFAPKTIINPHFQPEQKAMVAQQKSPLR